MDASGKYNQSRMVNWYDPRQLLGTALKALVSGTFASYADKRELQAALAPGCEPIDCSKDSLTGDDLNELWIDFVSDTGDGFNSTYTVADLVAQSLKIKLIPDYQGERKTEITEWSLPAGDVLLFGGDQVYPTPSMADYENKFKIPFRAASKKHHALETKRKMFAIPGNHDWYDGLGSFLKLFCQKRHIGMWHTQQQRSYYALKLPKNYWLWATDVQLNSDIDQPQMDYFRDIALRFMQHGDKVILVTAEPAWVYKLIDRSNTSYKRLKFFEQVFITDDRYGLLGGKKFQLAATLTGDFHHYSRYEEFKKTSEGMEYINQLVTAGGGGAFLHPTHNLPKVLTGLNKPDDPVLNHTQYKDPEMKSCFPSQKQSRKIANNMLLFPFYNKAFWVSVSVIQLFLAWILQSTSQHENRNFMQQLSDVTGLGQFFSAVSQHLFINPAVLIISLFVVIGLYVFADGDSGKRNYKWIGAVHGLVQLLSMFLFIWLFSWFNISILNIQNKTVNLVVYVAETFFLGGLTGSFIMGVYLWFCSLYLDIHIDESFSAFGYPHFKNFLRIHIQPDGKVSIYPVGIEKVVTHWKQDGRGENITFHSSEAAKYYLIEPPVIIQNS